MNWLRHPIFRAASAARPFLRSLCTDATSVDVAILGAGTAGLSVAGLIKKNTKSVRSIVLDDNDAAGGSWQHRWESLKLFSTRRWSSLPLMPMPGESDSYPSSHDMANYLADYEKQIGIHVQRPVTVVSVESLAGSDQFLLSSACRRRWTARAVVCCTGGNHTPLRPSVLGSEDFHGTQLHSMEYKSPDVFAGKRVVVVGEGNSGAQILSEVSTRAADVLWVTSKEPEFLPETMSGKEVFDISAKALLAAKKHAEASEDKAVEKASMHAALKAIPSLQKIIFVDSVQAAAARGVFEWHRRPFSHFTPTGVAWADGSTWDADTVVWCTGYGFDTAMLRPLGVLDSKGRAHVRGTRSSAVPGLWLVGYGHWTGVGSGSIPGVVVTAQSTAHEVLDFLQVGKARA